MYLRLNHQHKNKKRVQGIYITDTLYFYIKELDMNGIEITENEKLIILRKRKNISQQEVAKKLMVSQAYISMFENGKENMREDLLEKYKQYIITV